MMAKFTFSFDSDDCAVNMEYYFAEDEFSKMDAISKFEQFLRGCGVEIDGKLSIKTKSQIDFEEINFELNNYVNPFYSVMEDHMNMVSNYDNVMNIDLGDLEFEVQPETCGVGGGSTCGNCGCGKNAN